MVFPRIVITGPESSGKTTLCRYLADTLQIPMALEYARIYLEAYGPDYDLEILQTIAREHLEYQQQQVPESARLGLFDTDLINFKIWADEVFGCCPDEITQGIRNEAHHRYLLCAPDLPWEPDPLRENPDNRDYLFQRHLGEIQRLGRPYEIVRGSGDARLRSADEAIRKLLR
ncbi:AAA family ATPase [Sulfuriroseicoccus oceanibius]|uniref:ATP-binding protein n=1 Tax=Sulfuriroseicoccus oceanibius TaxID=2707525 RepID=A0A6B3LA23_9BACT|nr:ATP-binding protein [Sulfuriroseicoccus oceanibius]QQL46125.1 ATP-binding protein [Sulfuriroseicoccus oceanibius]